MQTLGWVKRHLPVAKRPQVVVCGGGPAGIGAALGSVRTGAETLLVEQFGCVGGMATSGLLLPFGDTQPALVAELFKRLASEGAAQGWAFDPEALKFGAERMLVEAGVQLLYHTSACEAIVEENAACGAIVQNKSGRQAILARVVVDTSGDADIAADAGAPFTKGRPEDGLMQPVTLMFRLGGVDLASYEAYRKSDHRLEAALATAIRERDMEPFGNTVMGSVQVPGRNEIVLNLTNLTEIDGTDADDLTRAEIETRRQVHQLVRVFRKRVPGCGQAYLIDTAATVGVRETRQITGEYVFDREDVLQARKFDDAVARNIFEIDIHPVQGIGRARHEWGKLRTADQKWVDIPYRCLVPLQIENLLVAGRCFSATHEGMAAPRRMGPCMAMGHAAGAAAALAVRTGVTPRELDVKLLQQTLRSQGVEI